MQQIQCVVSIPTEGHPNVIGIIGDLVGAKTCEAAENKASSEGGDTA